MATRRKAETRSRITTRSSKAKQQPAEQATTAASQTSTITNTNTTTTRLILSSSSISEPYSPNSPVKKSVEIKNDEEEHDDDGCWSTPKAKRFRIPEIESCPPAPKKQRPGACDHDASNCSMRRSSIPFFTPPELADFFFSVPNMSAA